MAVRKYDHLIKPLKIAEMPGGSAMFRNTGNADVNRWLNGRDHLEGVKLNFSWGFYTGLGDWHPGMDPHVHPYPECLVFVGLDPARPNYLGAKLKYHLGKELEVHDFDKPTVVIAPAGFYHCPSITMDVSSPIGYSFFIISLGADPKSHWLGDGLSEEQLRARMSGAPQGGRRPPMESTFGKKRVHVSEETVSYGHLYDDYLKPMKPNTRRLRGADKALCGLFEGGRKPGPGASPDAVWMFGQDLLGMKLNYLWAIHSSAGQWLRGPGSGVHVHPHDEVLVIAGTEPADIDYLGAEIQIDMGPERERYIIDKPTAIVCPAGFPHGQVITRWVDKPYGVLMMNLGPTHETKYMD